MNISAIKMVSKELKRILIYFCFLFIYLSSFVGMVIGITHFFVGLKNPKLGLSRIILYIVDYKFNSKNT